MAPSHNGNNPTAGLLAKLAELDADREAIRRALALVGVNVPENTHAQGAKVAQTMASAVRIDKQRRKRTNATPEQRAERVAFIRSFLKEHPLSATAAVTAGLAKIGHELSTSRVSQIMFDLPDVQRVGTLAESRYRLKQTAPPKPVNLASRKAAAKAAAKRKKPGPWARAHKAQAASVAFDGSRAEKARQVVAIVRDAPGGLLSLKELGRLTREAGITSLTGTVNYIRAGFLRRTRDKAGATAYRFLRMPPEPEAAPEPEPAPVPAVEGIGTVDTVDTIEV